MSKTSAAASELISEIFRLNNRLLATGDALVADLGLTSARSQVLGALSAQPATASQTARTLGLTRQAVQRVVNELAAEGFLIAVPNPRHRRASLLRPSEKGYRAIAAAAARQAPWAEALAGGLAPQKIQRMAQRLRRMRERLETPAALSPA